jgi:hypothetical protein
MTYENILASLEARYKVQVQRVADFKKAVSLAHDLGEDTLDEEAAVVEAEAELKRITDVINKHKAALGKK